MTSPYTPKSSGWGFRRLVNEGGGVGDRKRIAVVVSRLAQDLARESVQLGGVVALLLDDSVEVLAVGRIYPLQRRPSLIGGVDIPAQFPRLNGDPAGRLVMHSGDVKHALHRSVVGKFEAAFSSLTELLLYRSVAGNVPPQIKAFGDTWRWDRAAAAYEEVVEGGGEISRVMQAFRTILAESNMLAYLAMMAPRLVELQRVLKPSGSLYLHCLRGVIEREEAEIGVLITMREPTQPMRIEAADAGYYRSGSERVGSWGITPGFSS